jgi:hypothetical protein
MHDHPKNRHHTLRKRKLSLVIPDFSVLPESAPGLSERKVGPPRLSYRCATAADQAFVDSGSTDSGTGTT